ncbi:hypothetical protein ACQJBY_037658 [Aegilops geniculata]
MDRRAAAAPNPTQPNHPERLSRRFAAAPISRRRAAVPRLPAPRPPTSAFELPDRNPRRRPVAFPDLWRRADGSVLVLVKEGPRLPAAGRDQGRLPAGSA